jgi:hypothetical protein
MPQGKFNMNKISEVSFPLGPITCLGLFIVYLTSCVSELGDKYCVCSISVSRN